MPGWRKTLSALFGRGRWEAGLDAELRHHVELRAADLVRSGLSAEAARRQARLELGSQERYKEEARAAFGLRWLDLCRQDIRYALRTLRRSPGYTVTSIAVLALAIGANTAMFSVMNAVLFRPLPYPSPDRLTMLWSEVPGQGLREGRTAYRTIEQWRSQNRSFAALSFFDPASATLTTKEGAEKISVMRVSPDFFPLTGLQPALGRVFSAREAEQRQPAALVSHAFWQNRLGGSENAIGTVLDIDGHPSQVIGVMPADLRFLGADSEVWEPHTLFPDWETRQSAQGAGPWFVLGRLRDGVTIQQAQRDMSALAANTGEQRGVSVVPLHEQLVGRTPRLALWMLAGAVSLVLLIAVFNAAGLSAARGMARAQEFAIRAALGAGRKRIVWQLLVENLMLALASGALGMAIAAGVLRFVRIVQPGGFAQLRDLHLDPVVLLWALALCLLSGTLVSMAPAILVSRRHARLAGWDGTKGVAGGRATQTVRRTLVATEFAMAVLLLAGAGLLIRSLWLVQRADLGFRPEHILSAQLATPGALPAASRPGFYSRVLEEVNSLPGVETSALIGDLFVGGIGEQTVSTASQSVRLRLRRDEVSGSFFQATGVPLLRGRSFTPQDGTAAPRVAIVNERMARQLWPEREALGQVFKFGPQDSPQPWFTVVGVVGDMRRQGLETEPGPQLFEPVAQNPSRLATLLVKTGSRDPLLLSASIPAAVHRVEPFAAVYGVTTLEARLDDFLAPRRFQTWLATAFAGAALLIAAVGIFGVIQYSVSMRTGEIGIRMALGSRPESIFRMILGEGLSLTSIGLAIGIAAALCFSQSASGLLYGVSGADPWTFAAVSLILAAVSLAACYFPARRAMRIDPVRALRNE